MLFNMLSIRQTLLFLSGLDLNCDVPLLKSSVRFCNST